MRGPLAISRSRSLALWDDDTVSPIADWLDVNGDFCDPAHALACVLQHPASGSWLAIALDGYEDTTLH